MRLLWLILILCSLSYVQGRHPLTRPWLLSNHPEWQKYYAHLCAISVGNEPLCNTMGPVLGYNFTLTPTQLKRSLVYMGPNHRLRRVVWDMITGNKLVHVGVIGTSISFGTGASIVGVTDWFSQVNQTLRAAFPRAKIETHNGCFPATGSSFANVCLSRMVEPHVDLLIVDYTTNDFPSGQYFDDPKIKSYERLIRKALKKQNLPAVVLLQIPAYGQAFAATHKEKHWFHQTVEDIYGSVAQYYSLPSISFRSALWLDMEGPPQHWGEVMDPDRIHPNDLGHTMVLDIFMWLLHQTTIDLVMVPYSKADALAVHAPLPQPMHPGNYDEPTELCMIDEHLKLAVVEAASPHWSLVDEGSGRKKKIGYVSTTPGSILTLQLDLGATLNLNLTAERVKALPAGSRIASVMVSYLKSYEHMGTALVRCAAGCTCKDQVLDAHELTRKTSTTYMTMLPTEAQQNLCNMTVTILNTTTSGEHKFKVTAIMLAPAMLEGFSWQQQQGGLEWAADKVFAGELH